MVDPALFSSSSDEWETPQWLFDKLDQEYHFICDAAATPLNKKCDIYLTDALSRRWIYKSIWVNPPYSKIGEFIKKAYNESCGGATVVCLLPSRTDTKWWHEFVMHSHEVMFIKGRLKFSGSKNSAPFPSCIVVFKGYTEGPFISTIRKDKS